jgi:hypothetical protein
VLRRDQHHLVAKLAQFPAPMVRSAARFEANHSAIQLGKERHKLAPPQLLAQHHLLLLVDPVQLEDALRRVDSDSC